MGAAARAIFLAAVASASILLVLVAQRPAALAEDSHHQWLAPAATDPSVVGCWIPAMIRRLVDVHMNMLPIGQC